MGAYRCPVASACTIRRDTYLVRNEEVERLLIEAMFLENPEEKEARQENKGKIDTSSGYGGDIGVPMVDEIRQTRYSLDNGLCRSVCECVGLCACCLCIIRAVLYRHSHLLNNKRLIVFKRDGHDDIPGGLQDEKDEADCNLEYEDFSIE